MFLRTENRTHEIHWNHICCTTCLLSALKRLGLLKLWPYVQSVCAFWPFYNSISTLEMQLFWMSLEGIVCNHRIPNYVVHICTSSFSHCVKMPVFVFLYNMYWTSLRLTSQWSCFYCSNHTSRCMPIFSQWVVSHAIEGILFWHLSAYQALICERLYNPVPYNYILRHCLYSVKPEKFTIEQIH